MFFPVYFSRPYNCRLLSAIHRVLNKLYWDYFRCVSSPPRSEKWKPYFLFCAEVPLLSRAPSRRGLVSEDIKDLLPQQKSVAWKESLFVWRIPLLQHWISFFDQRMFKLNGWNQILESKHLKGQLDPPLVTWRFLDQRRSVGPPVSDVTFFGPKEVSWTPPWVTKCTKMYLTELNPGPTIPI